MSATCPTCGETVDQTEIVWGYDSVDQTFVCDWCETEFILKTAYPEKVVSE
jgi:non-homologous end joining protein Ku